MVMEPNSTSWQSVEERTADFVDDPGVEPRTFQRHPGAKSGFAGDHRFFPYPELAEGLRQRPVSPENAG